MRDFSATADILLSSTLTVYSTVAFSVVDSVCVSASLWCRHLVNAYSVVMDNVTLACCFNTIQYNTIQ